MKRWKGPISIAMFIKSEKEEKELDGFIRRNYLSRSLVFSKYLSFYSDDYPYNKLRNMARDKISTSHFWVMDMDMWPSSNLYDTLLSLDRRYLEDENLAVIVPSFEYKKEDKNCQDFEICVSKYSSK